MIIAEYKNGNADVEIHDDGTRIIKYDEELKLDMALNIDIRVSNQCAFGYNPLTNKAFCSFCHEEARTDGSECDFENLKSVLEGLPRGIELAIGGNNITSNLMEFLKWANDRGYICNVTINQGHVARDLDKLIFAIDNQYIRGLGISFRPTLKWNVPEELLNYENTVFHVISGIDSFASVESLKNFGVKKILVLGEKDFGFNKGKVDLSARKHKEWNWWVHKLFSNFSAVSFDNLALQQMNIKRFFSQGSWDVFNQGEHSLYINAVDQYFSPSSRNPSKTPCNTTTIKEYFINL